MAISKTKYQASEAEIKELFSSHRVGNAIDSREMYDMAYNIV